MSAKASAWAWEMIKALCAPGLPGLGPAARLVLLKLADRADETGTCWPGHERTAGDTGLSHLSARRATQELEQRGLVKVTRQRDRAGRNVANRYQLALGVSFSAADLTRLPPHPAAILDEAGPTEERGRGTEVTGGGTQ